MVIKFWGTRGSIPVPGESTLKYGGNTPCLQVVTDKGRNLIFDAGTGIRLLGNKLINGELDKEIFLFISHTHWDHIHGLPFFLPLYNKNTKLNVYGNDSLPAEKIIETQLHSSFFPIDKDVLSAHIKYSIFKPGDSLEIDNILVEAIKVHHSKGTLAFKITDGSSKVVYMTDNEIFCRNDGNDPNFESVKALNVNLVDFCMDADYLIHDCMYSLRDFKSKKGWGHSNNISLAYFSIFANVKNLVLFHYEPNYNDATIDVIEKETQEILNNKDSKIKCIASREGMIIKI